MHVLLVEDDTDLVQFIQKGLRAENIQVSVAYDGIVGRSLIDTHRFDVIVLDINLPGINGFELCRFIKSHWPAVPVLLLTALGSLNDKEIGFEAGADDYLTKPFAFRELLLRLRALARRSAPDAPKHRILQLADLVVDTNAHTVRRAGQSIALTAREYTLLEYLMTNQGRVVSRTEILEHVWQLNFDTNTNIIDVYINYLRRKIDKDFEPKLLRTIVGAGYRLTADS